MLLRIKVRYDTYFAAMAFEMFNILLYRLLYNWLIIFLPRAAKRRDGFIVLAYFAYIIDDTYACISRHRHAATTIHTTTKWPGAIIRAIVAFIFARRQGYEYWYIYL